MKASWLTACSLAVFILLGAAMVRVSAPTFDEPVHLASGYTSLVQSRRILNGMDHPPLAEMWAALPLLALRPVVFFSHPDWLAGRVYNYADLFLYKNRVDARRLLDSARLWNLLTCAFLLGLPVLLWSRRLAGENGMAAAAVLFAFCPPLFSNAALAGNDALSSGLFFLTFWLLSQETRPLRLWAWAGAVMGLALAAKFNMIVLPALAAGVLLSDHRLERRKEPLPLAGLLCAAVCAALVLAAVYRFKNAGLYWDGLSATLKRLGEGRGSFLLGEHSTQGWLGYFPAALAVKTPLATLLAAGAGLAAARRWPRRELWWLLAPAAAYFAAACLSKTQIGYRHILPVYPFLLVAAASGGAWLWEKGRAGRAACGALAAWLALSVVGGAPHSLAYFNELALGRGYRWLVDSNLDWGQGLGPLAEEVRRRGNPPIFLSYFGTADPSYYGLRYAPLACVSTVDRREGLDTPGPGQPLLLAVSATNLQTVYFSDHELFSWLKDLAPAAMPGRSIFLYDLTSEPAAAAGLAGLIERAGNPGVARRILIEYGHGTPR